MAVEQKYPHIAKKEGEPARLESHPRTRVAQIVLDHLGQGWSADEIHRQHPYLSLAEIHGALSYYFDHAEEIDQEIEQEWKESLSLDSRTADSVVGKRLKALKRHRGYSPLS